MRAVRPELPAELDRVILRALEKDPGNRQQSAAELAAELKAIDSSGLIGSASSSGLGAPTMRGAKNLASGAHRAAPKKWLLPLIGMAALIGVAGAAGFHFLGQTPAATPTPLALASPLPSIAPTPSIAHTEIPVATPAPTASAAPTVAAVSAVPSGKPTSKSAPQTMGTLHMTADYWVYVHEQLGNADLNPGRDFPVDAHLKAGKHTLLLSREFTDGRTNPHFWQILPVTIVPAKTTYVVVTTLKDKAEVVSPP
jgi:hypothetical protein